MYLGLQQQKERMIDFMKKTKMAKLIGLVLVMALVLCVSALPAFATPTTSVDIYFQVGNGEPDYQYTVYTYRRAEHLHLFQ